MSGRGLKVWSVSFSPFLCADNSDLHFMINQDGLGGCGIGSKDFVNLWASARATCGVKGGKYFFEVKVDSNVDVEIDDTEEHPHALRQVIN